MRVTIQDRETLVRVRPLLMAAYLRTAGWKRVAYEPGRYSIWAGGPGSGEDLELLLPLDTKLGDYAERMAELLADLQRVEERSQISILNDVETTSSDVFRFREDPPTASGTIPLEEGARLVTSVRDFLLYAATAEYSPARQSLAGPRADEVNHFMTKALLGQTEASSFVVRAQVPVPGMPMDDLFPEVVESRVEPFQRRVGVRLMKILSETREAALEAVQTRNFAPFYDLLKAGASIGLYNTIAEAQQIVPSSPLEISCKWAPNRPVVAKPPSEVSFEPEIMPPIQEAVRILRPTVPLEDVQLIGTVRVLRREEQEELVNELSLATLIDGRPRNVRFFLETPEYRLAIQAFDAQVALAVTGDLVKEGKFWRLKRPRDVQVLTAQEENEEEGDD